MEFLNIVGFNRLRKAKEKERLKEEAVRENQKSEQKEIQMSKDNKNIYLIAGAVAVLGAIIIIYKTRKK